MERSHAATILLAHVFSQTRYLWLAPPPAPPALGDLRDVLAFWLSDAGAALDEGFSGQLRGADRSRLLADATAHLEAVADAGAALIMLGDARYPESLAAIADPPLVLTALGTPALLQCEKRSAVVGSRKASAHALRESYELGRLLASAEHVVVSGGALGCDIAAHAGTLALRCDPVPAVVVLAGGLARFYPDANRRYFDALRRRGALFISERLWSAPCRPLDFRARNRIICGLAATTYVMQAARTSGAMITARQALDQGRELAVLTHPPGDIRAAGGAALLVDGARGFAAAAELFVPTNGGVLDKAAGKDYSYGHSTHDDVRTPRSSRGGDGSIALGTSGMVARGSVDRGSGAT